MFQKLKMLPRSLAGRGVPYFLLGSLAFLYLKTFILPVTPIYQGDTAPIFLLDAARMVEGQVLYRDFFELVFPGAPAVYFVLFKVFGMRAWIPSVTLILLGMGLGWMSYVISKRLVRGVSVFLPGLLFLAFGYGNALDATHHWFSVLAVMAAVALIIENRTLKNLAGAGGLCGLATWFTQSRGIAALVGLALFLVWEWRAKRRYWSWLAKTEACLLASFLATGVPLTAYFAWKAGLERFRYCTGTFIREYFFAFRWNQLRAYMVQVPEFSTWVQVPAWGIWLFVHMLVPLVFLLFFARYWREAGVRPQESWDALMLLNIVGLFSFLSIAFAPAWLRVCTALLPALILFVWFMDSPGRLHRAIRGVLWVVGLTVAMVGPAIVQTGGWRYFHSPVGRVVLLELERHEKFRWVRDRTRPGEFLFHGTDYDIYFLLGLRNPAEVPFLTATDYTRPEQVRNVVEALERYRVRFVLWSVDLDLRDEDHPSGDHLGPLRTFLHKRYQVVKTFCDGSQVWARRS